jgi:hypothetical protein
MDNKNPTKSKKAKRLIAKPITKSSSMVDEELHGRRLKFHTCTVDQLPILVILF